MAISETRPITNYTVWFPNAIPLSQRWEVLCQPYHKNKPNLNPNTNINPNPMIVDNDDTDLDVSDTCVRNSLLS